MTPTQKPGKSKQDYRTPPEFLTAVLNRLKVTDFSWDLAASADNTVTENGWYTEEQDSLTQPWAGLHDSGWLWCNPPYSNIEPWVKKAAFETQQGAQVAMLLPASVGSNWWRTWVEGYAYQVYLNGRLAFMEDHPDWLYPKDCALLLYHPWGFTGHEIWSWRAAKTK